MILSIYSRNIYLHPLNYYKRKIATNNISWCRLYTCRMGFLKEISIKLNGTFYISVLVAVSNKELGNFVLRETWSYIWNTFVYSIKKYLLCISQFLFFSYDISLIFNIISQKRKHNIWRFNNNNISGVILIQC